MIACLKPPDSWNIAHVSTLPTGTTFMPIYVVSPHGGLEGSRTTRNHENSWKNLKKHEKWPNLAKTGQNPVLGPYHAVLGPDPQKWPKNDEKTRKNVKKRHFWLLGVGRDRVFAKKAFFRLSEPVFSVPAEEYWEAATPFFSRYPLFFPKNGKTSVWL